MLHLFKNKSSEVFVCNINEEKLGRKTDKLESFYCHLTCIYIKFESTKCLYIKIWYSVHGILESEQL